MIRSSRLIPYRLPLKQAWNTAQGRFTERAGILIELMTEDGRKGYGDCAPLPLVGTETYAQASDWLATHLSAWHGLSLAAGLQRLDQGPQHGLPATRCALELALLDLQAQQTSLSLAKWLNPEAAPSVRVNAALGSSEQGLAAEPMAGITIFKIKVGVHPPPQEIAQLESLCEKLPPQAQLRLDANGTWNLEQATAFIKGINSLPIESLEEPLAQPTNASLRTLQAQAPFPLALDESLPRFCGNKDLAAYPVSRLVLKPMALGGLLPALTLARQADTAGLACVVTTTVDSAVGVWGAVHLTAALGQAAQSLAHGLATSDWLVRDVAVPPVIEQGRIAVPTQPGLGIVLT